MSAKYSHLFDRGINSANKIKFKKQISFIYEKDFLDEEFVSEKELEDEELELFNMVSKAADYASLYGDKIEKEQQIKNEFCYYQQGSFSGQFGKNVFGKNIPDFGIDRIGNFPDFAQEQPEEYQEKSTLLFYMFLHGYEHVNFLINSEDLKNKDFTKVYFERSCT